MTEPSSSLNMATYHRNNNKSLPFPKTSTFNRKQLITQMMRSKNFSSFNDKNLFFSQLKTNESNYSETGSPVNPIVETHSQLIIVLLAIIMIVGVFGNLLNIIVFSKKTMRKVSTFRFLLYLSIGDLLVLFVCVTDALLRFGYQYELRLSSTFVCRLHTFFTYFLTHFSSTLLMVISIDRALVVTNRTLTSLFCCKKNKKYITSLNKKHQQQQHQRNLLNGEDRFDLKETSGMGLSSSLYRLCRLHRVDLVVAFVVIVLGLLNSHYFIFLKLNATVESIESSKATLYQETEELDSDAYASSEAAASLPFQHTKNELFHICYALKGTVYNKFLKQIWLWIDICAYSLVPFFAMSICSIIILARVKRQSKKYLNVLTNKNLENNKSHIYNRLRRNRQLIYMLLLTNLYFLLTLLPYSVTFVLFHGQKSENTLGQSLVHILLYSNNAVNFLFYGLSSHKYREEFCKTFWTNHKNRRGSSNTNNELKIINSPSLNNQINNFDK